MPWKNNSLMDQKIAFIREWESGQFYFNSLCEAYSISRKTGYKIINRYKESGIHYLDDRSRKPLNSPDSTDQNIIDEVKLWRGKKEEKWNHPTLFLILRNVMKFGPLTTKVPFYSVIKNVVSH